MAQGLQVWDASGSLILDTSTRIGTVLGIRTTSESGSLSDPALVKGRPFCVNTGLWNGRNIEFSSSGTTLTWTIDNVSSSSNSFTFFYGVY